MNLFKIYWLLLTFAVTSQAQLAVTIMPAKVTGQKAVITLHFQNNFTNEIESARAICFLLDDQGKMVGEATKWVIGEKKKILEPGAASSFNFVVTGRAPFATTNLTARVSFTRILLEGNKLADPNKDVSISTAMFQGSKQ